MGTESESHDEEGAAWKAVSHVAAAVYNRTPIPALSLRARLSPPPPVSPLALAILPRRTTKPPAAALRFASPRVGTATSACGDGGAGA